MDIKKVKMLGIEIDNILFKEAIETARLFLHDKNPRFMVTCNPEIILLAQKDEYYRRVLNSADISVTDGIGLIVMSRLSGHPLKERVVGVDFLESFCGICEKEEKSVFFFGSAKEVSKKASQKLQIKYPNLKIAGCLDGDINLATAHTAINASEPDVLFVALGAPKQEKWIYENLPKINSAKLAIGVGGAFDFLSGNVMRAPRFMRHIGLEWLWRLIIQPWRIKRIFNAIIIFPILFMCDIAKIEKKNL